MKTRSRTTLFLIEQLIVIAVFAICAAACARILTSAYFAAVDTRELSNAILVAENGAECYKAVQGDIAKASAVLSGVSTQADGAPAIVVFYNKQWLVCNEADASFKLLLACGTRPPGSGNLLSGNLSVEKITGEQLISFPVTTIG